MSLYAVQDNVGNYWDFDNRGFHSPQNNARRNTTFNLALADAIVQMNGGHVVELIEAPAKVVVSEEEAEMLEQAKRNKFPATLISNRTNDEDRLMRAYVNGWTVEKPKRYVLPMPDGTDDEDQEDMQYVAVNRSYYAGPVWFQGPRVTFQQAQARYSVTQAEIDTAPDWVKAITPVEVTDNDND